MLLGFYWIFTLPFVFLGFIARLLRWVFFYLEKKDLGLLFPREKKCGFFPFWLNECVLNYDLDVLCLVGEKMWERKKCFNFEYWILLSLGLGKT